MTKSAAIVSRLSLALVGAVLFSHAAANLAGLASGTSWQILNSTLFAGCSALTAAVLWYTAQTASDERSNTAWQRLAIAQSISTLGDLIWVSYTLHEISPFPSLADINYLIFYPVALWGLITFPTTSNSMVERPTLMIDVAALLVGSAMIVWYLLGAAVPADFSPLNVATSLAYPLGDVALLLGFTLIMMRRPISLRWLSQLMILGWIISLLVGDIGFAVLNMNNNYSDGGWIDTLWLVGNLLLIFAATRGEPGPSGHTTTRSFNTPLPYITIVAGYGLLIIAAGDYYARPIGGLIIGSALLTALLMARQIVAMRQNMRLLEEQARLEARERAAAEASNKAKSEFLAVMSHELRTPLTAILGYSELLEIQAAQRNLDSFIPDLREIERAGHQLLDTLNNVLDMARLESGRLTLNPQPFDLESFVADLETAVAGLARTNGNQLQVEAQPNLGVVTLDSLRLRQALIYLLANACKFTENGVVTLRVTKDERLILFEVSDTGIGIAPEQIGRLFQPFQQVDSGITRQYGGSGLGLALSHRICLLMGGAIGVVSEPQRGTTFTVRIPLL